MLGYKLYVILISPFKAFFPRFKVPLYFVYLSVDSFLFLSSLSCLFPFFFNRVTAHRFKVIFTVSSVSYNVSFVTFVFTS